MPYAIVLSFDEESSFPINKLFKKFKERKIGSMLYEEKMKPHITLNNYETINTDTAKERLELFCIENKPLKIQISSIGYFPSEESVLFLNPKASTELLNVQQKVFRLFKDFEAEFSPTTWVPHCTLGIYLQKKDLSKAIDIIKEEIVITKENPFYITAEAISFVKFEKNPLIINWWLDYKLKG
ncbi:MAG: 2'-5' RNA ligase family protein [Promethearchaeota archaeon]